jgi:hypothetical protein
LLCINRLAPDINKTTKVTQMETCTQMVAIFNILKEIIYSNYDYQVYPK